MYILKAFREGTLAQRRMAFLKSTIKHYNANNLCFNTNGGCQYSKTEDSKGCAIGRWLPARLASQLDSREDNTDVSNWDVFKSLPDWMISLRADFLASIQSLHDGPFNWDENGLSKIGKDAVELIVKRYEL
jgi:hypothetical protein